MHPFLAVSEVADFIRSEHASSPLSPADPVLRALELLHAAISVLHPSADDATIDATCTAVWMRLTDEKIVEHSGVRFCLTPEADDILSIEHAGRAHGSPESLMPACRVCAAVTDEFVCAKCFDLHRPARTPEAHAHREIVRARLLQAPVRGSELDQVWQRICESATDRKHRFILSNARPLALHATGTLCVAGADARHAEALARYIGHTEAVLVKHQLPAVTILIAALVDTRTGADLTPTLQSCSAMHSRVPPFISAL